MKNIHTCLLTPGKKAQEEGRNFPGLWPVSHDHPCMGLSQPLLLRHSSPLRKRLQLQRIVYTRWGKSWLGPSPAFEWGKGGLCWCSQGRWIGRCLKLCLPCWDCPSMHCLLHRVPNPAPLASVLLPMEVKVLMPRGERAYT